ncbi:protein DMR6-LIKE OXYGENASE 2-like [Rosa rugosa]|uniref:protein DMR6-LIKE OXYGENASE 2-like n=1 Tax=Rosa rugosa TaxID=74645 RepID=UPI002B40E555|nr:protein DMR6-LIKE OXYGENASE 2-like [Rosa rugosa]
MGEVDPAFIQDPEHRPKLSIIEAEGIPSIDLSPVTLQDFISYPKSIEGVVREIGNACKEWGFFQVINHGVPLEKLQRIQAAARKLFAQPLEDKRKIRRDERNALGYFDTESTKNIRDWKEVFDFSMEDTTLVPASPDPEDKEEATWTNQWPEYPPELREACEEYTQEVEKLALKLLGLIARSLGLPENRFNSYFKDQSTRIRLNHYPPCPSPQLALGVGRHKDGGALTVLAQDEVGGLEVKRKTDGEWIRVKPTPNAYIINVGDIMQVWSNDRYESVEHRVMVDSDKERFSIPFFFNPAHYTLVKPVEELIDEQNPAKYRPYSWGKFMTHRRLSNFKKLGVDNIQIYDFRL